MSQTRHTIAQASHRAGPSRNTVRLGSIDRILLGLAAALVFLALSLLNMRPELATQIASGPQVAPQPLRMPELVDHHFSGCNEARAMGMTNIPIGHPSYRASMDGDGDGLACEPYHSGGGRYIVRR